MLKRKIILFIFPISLIFFAFTHSNKIGTEQNHTDKCLDSLVFMDAFSPNEDGNNDIFSIDFPCQPNLFKIEVLNNFGEEVFRSSKYDFKWNGKDANDMPASNGVYAWRMSYTFNNKKVELTGEIVLMR